MTRDEAMAAVKSAIRDMPQETEISMGPAPLRPAAFAMAHPHVSCDHHPHAKGSWIAACDPLPLARWGHRARYVLVDPDGTSRSFDAPVYPTRGTDVLHDERAL